MVWMVNVSKKNRLYKNALPIHRKIYDTANMMVYKKHLQIMSLNPNAELVRVKTDLLGYINIEKDIETSYEWGDIKIEHSPPKPAEIWDKTKYIRTAVYKHTDSQWNNN